MTRLPRGADHVAPPRAALSRSLGELRQLAKLDDTPETKDLAFVMLALPPLCTPRETGLSSSTSMHLPQSTRSRGPDATEVEPGTGAG